MSKATFVTHSDFLSYPPSLNLAQFDGCVWALGKSQVGMKEDEYIRMTHDFPMEAARAIIEAKKAAKSAGEAEGDKPLRFVYVSGQSADQTGKSWILFARVKGKTEADLVKVSEESDGILIPHFLRPGYFFPEAEDARDTRGTFARLTDKIRTPMISTFIPNLYIRARSLGQFAVEAAKGTWGNDQIFDNARMTALLKERFGGSSSGDVARDEL
ncbi:hypothetical protein PUNSTDRAFT_52399 [Punctularia strigosozonata HHB-11173 SS5]|uniref:uncharacterized protein n=1 Tax=Punctularia strigosozonata (strain HHB-11173) TaxID=741275 RepID=UPI0004418237|nr:uncharacterized protein PUNSTDRAFT_52399 [Punctularia strigosozonata HHB-11173 SS5]EIN08966.1 hypothetical protein PUNSTDRAFT_52399 [Punctularia strigosozonata HHB-11173 SS5]